jgi:hypothetical protein
MFSVSANGHTLSHEVQKHSVCKGTPTLLQQSLNMSSVGTSLNFLKENTTKKKHKFEETYKWFKFDMILGAFD